ncbi:phosphoglucosamine mutase-like protein [Wolffia australiana]
MEGQPSMLLQAASAFHPPPGKKITYGTAGFRADATILSSTVFRAGVLAVLRSLKNGGAAVGLMITASHNPVGDNGVKIADPGGGMMAQSWEPFADALAGAATAEDFVEIVLVFAAKEEIPIGRLEKSEVLLARDSRPSGATLIEAAKMGIASVAGAVAIDMGILTTPQLHWMVRQRNRGWGSSEMDYFLQLSNSFRSLIELSGEEPMASGYDPVLLVDAANGVGGGKLKELVKLLGAGIEIHVRNCGEEGEGLLNEGVGADFVQKEKTIPHGFTAQDTGKRCASLDGDADRIVYFTIRANDENKVDLVDGDKILSLFALFISEHLAIIADADDEKEDKKTKKKTLGVVQTAYANGASTEFLREMGVAVALAPTGVKHLHAMAAQYDVGIYFEANGHGTVLFAPGFLTKLQDLANLCSGTMREKAARTLLAVSEVVNQAVGDALSGMLLAEVILWHRGWSMQDWASLYQDLPSRQLKVKVANRNAVSTTESETRVVDPPGLQDAIDAETAKYNAGRSFVRPSGTEDVVRVYAEASTQAAADALAASVALHVSHYLSA